MAYNDRVIGAHCPIGVRRSLTVDGVTHTAVVEATPGRIIFNQNIPQDLGFVDRTDPAHVCDYEITFTCGKKQLGQIVDRTINKHGFTVAAEVLDAIKATGYKHSTLAAITVSIADMTVPPRSTSWWHASERKVLDIENQYKMGFMTDQERYKQVVQVWEKTTNDVSDALQKNLDRYNPIFMMADSGARGSMKQIRQLAGMRGLIANTAGRTIEIPIKANYREGLTALEYFISSQRRPEGPGRHRPADRRLRLPDPPDGGRLPGRHHPGGGLPRHPRHQGLRDQRERPGDREVLRPAPGPLPGGRRGGRRHRRGAALQHQDDGLRTTPSCWRPASGSRPTTGRATAAPSIRRWTTIPPS